MNKMHKTLYKRLTYELSKNFHNFVVATANAGYNLSAEWWSTVGQRIERRQIIIPNDEKLISQLTSRRKLYDSRGRERLESKADLKSRGVESPDRADALIWRRNDVTFGGSVRLRSSRR